jgi:hypothetical protein
LSIKIEGPRVGEARLSADDLATIILGVQQALRRIGQVLHGESSVGRGWKRKNKDIEKLCELFVVGWKPGSAVVEVELAEPSAEMRLLASLGEESLTAFLNGLTCIRDEPIESLEMLPRGFDAGVLQSCDSLGRVLGHGVNRVSFEPMRLDAVAPVTFDRPLRERIRTLVSILKDEIAERALGGKRERVPFWSSLRLEELAELQGVQPAEDLDQISAFWPVDDDPDRMLAYILEERSTRRQLRREEHDR